MVSLSFVSIILLIVFDGIAAKSYAKPMDFKTLYDRQNIIKSSAVLMDYKASLTGIEFATPFTNNTVLQREPYIAAIYGMSPTPNVQIKLTLKNEENGQSELLTINSMKNGDWKILLKKSYKNGGNYTILVECKECNNTQQIIYNVTFGDVYICTGQSNMWLPMEHTFSRNYTYQNMTEYNKYQNIRFITPINGHQSAILDENASFTRSIQNGDEGLWAQSFRIDLLEKFSAACWYFAQTLSDKYGLENIIFGLINTAIGGSVIESWSVNNTIWNFNTKSNGYCQSLDVNITPNYGWGSLYNGLVIPFINYTIRGQLWYQGENDIGRYQTGNVLNNTGYACIEKLMIEQWRANWSVVENTTDPFFHFGVTTLAPGGGEGNGWDLGNMRWSQSLNYDIMPNPVLKNTFIVQGYDIGDPWAKSCANKGICNTTTAPYSIVNTHWVDGPIHARPKIYVGQRHARSASKFIYGNDHIWSGPLISGCSLENNNNTLRINFNESLLYGEKVMVQSWSPWYNTSIPKPLYWSTTQILINKTKWIFINDNGLSAGNDGLSVVVDLTEFENKGTIDGIRYSWFATPCCGKLNTALYPCPMNSCPIVTSETLLPAAPIWAMIEDNKCICYPPQQC